MNINNGDVLRRLLLSSAAVGLSLAVAAPASAQETLELDPIVLEVEGAKNQRTGGHKGETIATTATAATKSAEPILETPRSLTVITEQTLEDQGVQDIDDALLYVPGVYASTYGRDTRGNWALIRGVSPPQFLNGLRTDFGFYNDIRINPYTLQSVEVLRGPASVLYGSNATGGIINMNSKLPQEKAYREAFAEYGTFNRKQIGFDLTGPVAGVSNLYYRVIGVGRQSGTQVDYVDDDSYLLAPSLTWKPTAVTNLTILGNLQKDRGASTSRFVPIVGSLLPTPSGQFIGSHQFFGEPGFDKLNPQQASLTGIFTHRFNENFDLDARARYSASSNAYDQIWPTFGVPYEPDGRSLKRTLYSARNAANSFVSDTRVNGKFITGIFKHETMLGVDYQNVSFDSNVFYGTLPPIDLITPSYGAVIPTITRTNNPKQDLQQVGVYIRDRISYDDRLFLTLGARRDDYEQSTRGSTAPGTEAQANTYSAGLLYKFDFGLAPYVSYATSFEPLAPDRFGFTYKPVEGAQLEAGVKYQPLGLPMLISAAVFELEQRNRQIPNPNFGPDSPAFIQAGETRIRGAELEVQGRIQDFEVLGGYTYLDAVNKATGYALPSVPVHQVSGWFTYRPQAGSLKGFVAGVGMRYVGKSFDGADKYVTPAYTLLDAMIGYEGERYAVKFNVQNITDEPYFTTCLARGDCFYGERRTAVLRVTGKF